MGTDTPYMRRALKLAQQAWGRTAPNPMVGCVLVRAGEIIGEGFHHAAGHPHAEVEALRSCRRDPRGATAYVTLEPCCTTGRTPPCTQALIQAGVSTVVIGALDPNPAHAGRGVKVLQDAGIEVRTGICRQACEELNYPFFKWITTGKPYVVLKMAMTLDGKIATASGDAKWVTGEKARQDVQRLRQLAGAIIVGSETAKLDHPRLTVRDIPDWPHQPARFIAGKPRMEGFTTVDLPHKEAWEHFLEKLGKDGCLYLMIEGGGVLAGRALQAGIVDEAVFYTAPKLLCGRGSRPVTGGEDPELLAEAILVDRLRTRRLGQDLRINGYIKGSWADVYRNR